MVFEIRSDVRCDSKLKNNYRGIWNLKFEGGVCFHVKKMNISDLLQKDYSGTLRFQYYRYVSRYLTKVCSRLHSCCTQLSGWYVSTIECW